MLINFNHLKTFYNALIQKMKGFRGNWEQNDDTADDYIKNRPFYSEGIKETEFFKKSSIDLNDYSKEQILTKLLIEGQTYQVTWNNKTYSCIAYNDGWDDICIGNLQIAEDVLNWGFENRPISSNEPFFISSYDDDNSVWSVVATKDADNHTLEIVIVEEVVHKLDKKFIDMPDLPDNLVTEEFLEDNLANVAFSGNYWDLYNTPDLSNNIQLSKTILPVNGYEWRSICYGNGKFVAVASAGYGAQSGCIIYSVNGKSWSRAQLPVTAKWTSVCYGNGKFVAISRSNNKTVAYSTDGINWESAELSATANWWSVCYGNNKFIAIAYNSNIANYSTDGINWTQSELPTTSTWQSVCYGDDKFVAIAGGSTTNNIAAYSTDGINWTTTMLPRFAFWTSVCYGNGKFVACSDAGSLETNIAAYSIDGINWTQITLPTITFWSSVCYGNGKFVAIAGDEYGNRRTNIAAYSTDGINWTQTILPTILGWLTVCYGGDKFIALAYNSELIGYSADGVNWTHGGVLIQSGNNVTPQVAAMIQPYINVVKTVNGNTPDETGNVEVLIAQSDWNQEDETQLDFIKNKPNITTDDELIDMMLETDVLPVVTDSDGTIFADEHGQILLW